MGSVDQFWSSLRSYHVSYNEFVLVAAGFFASGEGKDFDSGIVKFMERLSEHCMDEVLNHIVTIDEDLRSFLRPTSQETLGSPRSAGVVELWDVECVHVHSLWCYARQAGLLCSREAIQFMFDCSTGKTIACERLESVVPGVTREKNWVQSVISNLSLLVVHAADLDDIIFNAVNFLLSDHGGAGTSVTIRQKDFLHSVPADEAPIRVAVLLPDALLVQPMQLPASIRYAYFPFCIYKFLEEYECLESIHGRCKGINSDGGRLDHNSLRVSLRAVLEVLEEKLVTPDWISPEDCLRICNSVCDSICLRGCSADANRALDRTLSVLDMYEVFFAVAQSCKVGTQALNSSLGERDSISHTISKTDQQLRELQTSANLSINAWGSLEVLLSKLAEVGDVRKIGAHSAVKSVYNCGHDVAEIFDDNIAAIICSSLYASSQPRWRGQWLVQTSVSEVPVSTFPLDSPMKCTMDIVLFAAIINYPLSTPGYNIWTLLEHFSRCDTPSRPGSEKSGGSPIHEVCARRMYEFLRFLSDNYRIRTSDLLCHLQLSLLANECFDEASNDSVMRSEGNRKEIALQALASLSSQATLVLRLSSKAVWRTVSCSETSFVWEFLVSCGTSYGQYRGCKANHISQLDVWKRIAVSGVPDVASLQCGGILMNRAAAITWATEVTALFRYEISALEVTKVANRFIDKLFHIRGFSDAGCGAVLSFGMFIVFGLHVLCSCDGDIKRATSKWCDYSNSRAKERYWESHVPASALLLSPKRLQMVLELDNVRELVRKSIKIFDAAQSKSIRFSDVGLNSLTCTAPPRPPGKLWDAPRCVQFCRQMGIQEYLSKEVYNLTDKSGINVVWNAVAIALKPHYSSAKLSPWASHSVVAPLPFQVSVDSIIDFLNILAKHLVTVQTDEQNSPSGIQEMVARLVMGSLCPLIVAHETVIGRTAGVEGGSDSRCAIDFSFPFSLEDMLRFGGGKVAATLNHYHSWLFEEYKFLSSAERVKFDAKNDLVTLSDACTYFSCKGLLKIKTAILVAGVSLSPRWRSAVGTVLAGDILSSDENRGEILKIAANNAAGRIHRARTAPPCETDVYITFQEFEELFLRCGYALYEQAGYLSALAPGQTTQSDFDHCKTPDLKSIVRHYVTECEKLRQLGKSKTTQFVSGSWGMDFLYPLASTLQLVSTQRDRSGLQIKPPNFVSKSEADPRGSISIEISKLISSSTGAAVTDPSSNEAAAQKGDLSHRVGGDESTASFSQLSVSFNSSAGPVVLPAPKNVVGIVDDAIIRGRDKYLETILAARQQQPTDGDVKDVRSAVQLKLSVPTRTSSGRRSPGAGSPNTRGSPRGSPRPTRSPKRSSPQSPAATERSIGIDALLDGTKEVLWPVFATYCSCGDSMEPGKLSGPNLFALLSKLNVLTDETALSDIGVLLHQVSSHTTAQAPSVAIFVDGDDENGLDSPLLSFEEFLVFLCAFSHLRYEGTSVLPDFSGKYARGGESTAQAVRPFSPEGDIANLSTDSVSSMIDLQGPTGETWLECWYHGEAYVSFSIHNFYIYIFPGSYGDLAFISTAA